MNEPAPLRLPNRTGIEARLRVAGPGARALGFTIDAAIRGTLAVLWYLGGAALHARLGDGVWSIEAPFEPGAAWFIGVLLPAAALLLLYHPVLEYALEGVTPGRRLAGTRIVALDGQPPGALAVLIRNLFRLVDALPLLYVVGLAACMLTGRQQRLGDLAAGTLLVYEFGAALPAAEPERLTLDQALAQVTAFEKLAAEVAAARRDPRQVATRAGLERRFAAAQVALAREPRDLRAALRREIRQQIPLALRESRSAIAWVAMMFAGTVAAGLWLVGREPALAGLFASPEMLATLERGDLWTDGLLGVLPASVLSVQVFANNLAVSVSAFVLGALYGLGTFYIVAVNGLGLGALLAAAAEHDLAPALLAFLAPHGPTEFLCLILSGAAGLQLGEAIARPRHGSRGESLRLATPRALRLLVPVAALLVLCGAIEGWVSPRDDLSLATRCGVGAGLLGLALLALTRRPRPAVRAAR